MPDIYFIEDMYDVQDLLYFDALNYGVAPTYEVLRCIPKVTAVGRGNGGIGGSKAAFWQDNKNINVI